MINIERNIEVTFKNLKQNKYIFLVQIFHYFIIFDKQNVVSCSQKPIERLKADNWHVAIYERHLKLHGIGLINLIIAINIIIASIRINTFEIVPFRDFYLY